MGWSILDAGFTPNLVRIARRFTPSTINRTLALHGAELLRRGFSVDQVVHDYGDMCQCVTTLALEQDVSISMDAYRTLDRCIDNAIAGAVVSFGCGKQDASKTSR